MMFPQLSGIKVRKAVVKRIGRISVKILLFFLIALAGAAQAEDYYQILGVSRNATDQELKSAYRKKAMDTHPDRHPDDPSAEEKFKAASEAYQVLSDPDKRAAYDRYGSSRATSSASRDAPPRRTQAEPKRSTSLNPFQQQAVSIVNAIDPDLVRYGISSLLRFNSQAQVDALKIAAKVREGGVRYDYDSLVKFRTSIQLEALKVAAEISGENIRSDYSSILQFETPVQVRALMIAGAVRGSGVHYDYDSLLKFKTPIQIEALRAAAKLSGADIRSDYSSILQFETPDQVAALEAAGKVRGKGIHYDYDSLLKFKDPIQVDALRAATRLGGEVRRDYDSLLTFKNKYQVDALNLAITHQGREVSRYYSEVLNFDDEGLRDVLKEQLSKRGKSSSLASIYEAELTRLGKILGKSLTLDHPDTLIEQLSSSTPQRRVEREARIGFLNDNMDVILSHIQSPDQLMHIAQFSENSFDELAQRYEEHVTERKKFLTFKERLKEAKSNVKSFAEFQKEFFHPSTPAELHEELRAFVNREHEWLTSLPDFSEDSLYSIRQQLGNFEASPYVNAVADQTVGQRDLLAFALRLNGKDPTWPQMVLEPRMETVLTGPIPVNTADHLMNLGRLRNTIRVEVGKNLLQQFSNSRELKDFSFPEDMMKMKEFKTYYDETARDLNPVFQCFKKAVRSFSGQN